MEWDTPVLTKTRYPSAITMFHRSSCPGRKESTIGGPQVARFKVQPRPPSTSVLSVMRIHLPIFHETCTEN